MDFGHSSQVVISRDICTKVRLKKYGGHGYAHIFGNILPLMRTLDFTEDEISTIMVNNPRRLLAFR